LFPNTIVSGADRSGRAGRILDDDVLPERLRHVLGDDAGNGVGRAARRVGHHHLDDAGREVLRSGGGREKGSAGNETERHTACD
jgi:hypothetical protein